MFINLSKIVHIPKYFITAKFKKDILLNYSNKFIPQKMRRTKTQQSKHNTRVRKVAGGYKSQGWKVQADVSGYSKPRTIFNKRPDIRATKGAKERIIEVETKSSMKSDTAQRNAFKRFAGLNKKRKFRTSVV